MGIRHGVTGGTRPRRAHWCRFTLIRPSIGGWVLIPVAVAVWYMALLLDERTLVAAALTLTAAWGLDLVMTVVQGVLIATSPLLPVDADAIPADVTRARTDTAGNTRTDTVNRGTARAVVRRPLDWRGLMLPAHPVATVQIERLDADGQRLERVVGLPQDTRGWYRRVARIIRWRSPMRLFAGRVPVRDGGEFVILPDAAAPSGNQHATDARLQGQDRTESTGTIRAYTPGDSPNLISWRHSAHRGTLMTRESGRDTRATLIIVLDAAVDQGDGDRGLEGHVIRAQQLLPATSSTDRFVVTDGIHMADDRASALRLLAAVTPAAQPRLHIRAQQLLPATSSTDRFVVTDGIHMADDRASALRLLAAVTPAAQPRLQPDADRTPSAVNRTPSDPADAADAADPATPQRAAAIIAAAAAVPGHGPVTIAVITSQPQGPLVQAIRTAVAGARTLPVQPWHEAAERMIATSLPERRSGAPTGRRRDRSPVIDARDRSRGIHAQDNPPSPTVALRLVRVGVLAAYVALTIMGAAGLADANGWWPWAAGLMLAAVIAESSIPSRTPLRGALRVVGMAVLLAVVGLTAAGVRIDAGSMLDAAGTVPGPSAGGGTPGVWDVIRLLPDMAAATGLTAAGVRIDAGSMLDAAGTVPGPSAGGGTPGVWDVIRLLPDMAAATVQGAATVGFESLRRQLPPLTVNPAGDACLIIICAMVAIAIRCLLYWRVGVPLLALLPLAALAADYSLVGHAAAWRQVLLLVVAFVLSLLTVRGTIGVSPPTCAAALAAVTTLAMALTPATLSLAYNVPLSIGESTGLFTSNTVNPMVDLRRTLQSRSRAVVLTYESGTPLTLRMTTLGDFDGDTWSYEEQFAKDGSLYGSGIQLGHDSSNTLSDEERTAGMMTPLSLYLTIDSMTSSGVIYNGGMRFSTTDSGVTLQRFGHDASVTIDRLNSRFLPMPGIVLGSVTAYGWGIPSGWLLYSDGTQRFGHDASVTIDRLNSRFLPMPGIVLGSVTAYGWGIPSGWLLYSDGTMYGWGIPSGWLLYSDGTVYNRTSAASSGMRYGAIGVYLDPIGSADGFRYGWGIPSGWLLYSDGTVYNRTSAASSGMRYGAIGVYLDPIGSADGFSQIDAVDAWRDQNLGEGNVTDWETRTRARLRYIAEGNARQVNGWMLIPVTGETDEYGSVSIWRDASGTEVGRDSDAFIDAVRFDDNENLIVFANADGTATVALPLYDPVEYYGDGAADENGTADADGTVSDDPVLDELLGMTGRFDAEGGERQRAEDAAFADLMDISQREGLGGSGMMIYQQVSPADSPWLRQALAEVERNQERVHDQYTALPDDLPQSVHAVVDQARSDGVTAPASGHDEQIAAMRWLVDYFTDPANGFVYTLDAPDGDGRNNLEVVDDFLERRSGYCSHYASALAVLGRALGVPTRMVLGYSASGVQAEADSTYEVTADQLHAWVEAYIDDVGWVPFDVTPTRMVLGYSASGVQAEADSTYEVTADQLHAWVEAYIDDVGWVPFDVTPASADDADADDTADTPAAQSGDDADAPVPGDDADAADGDGTTTDDDTPDSDGNTGEGDGATSERQASGAGGTSPATLLAWAVGGIGAVLVIVALCCLPMLVRRRRRRRRLRIASGSGSAGERWIAAWQEIVDGAWDNGVRWGKAETDRDIARHIADLLESGLSAGTETVEQVGRIAVQAMAWDNGVRWGKAETDRDIARHIADLLESGLSAGTETVEQVGRIAVQAMSAAFGGTSEHAGDLAPIVESAVEAMRAANVAPWYRRILGVLCPASLFRARR